jgi:hypothetical protein
LNAIVRLFRDPHAREQMGAGGAERVAGQFTEQHFQLRFWRLLGLN